MAITVCLYNFCLFERPFKIQNNGVFRFEISFFVLEILTIFVKRIRSVMTSYRLSLGVITGVILFCFFVMYICGAKFLEHCFNISRDIVYSVFYER